MPDRCSIRYEDTDEEPRSRPPVSVLLRNFAADWPHRRITLGAVAAALGDRAYGILFLLFAFPNVFPAPPGMSAVLGMPLILVAAQFVYGRHQPWFPRWLAERSIAREDFALIIERGIPWLHRVERLLKPRLLWATHFSAERTISLLCLVLAVVIALPIPFGNMLPALAISVIALGFFERDGVFVLGGAILGILSLVLAGSILFAAVKAFVFFLLSSS